MIELHKVPQTRDPKLSSEELMNLSWIRLKDIRKRYSLSLHSAFYGIYFFYMAISHPEEMRTIKFTEKGPYRAIPSWVSPLCPSESSCQTIDIKLCFAYGFISCKFNSFSYERFCTYSFWNRGTRELGNTPLRSWARTRLWARHCFAQIHQLVAMVARANRRHLGNSSRPYNGKQIVKDVPANCFCASLLRSQIHMPRHASSAR